jgi:DNA-3-methyladenine glycosylase II
MTQPESTDPRAEAIAEDMAALAAADRRLGPAAEASRRYSVALRRPGFDTLLRIILEQQVSTAAAAAMWRKLVERLGPVEPAGFLALGDDELKRCGFSRQKAGYGRALAEAVREGSIDLAAVAALPDEEALSVLCALKGIGRWSAENYLLWALGRRDVLPAQDLALLVGWQWLTGAERRPAADALRAEAEAWRPRRTAASFLIWHYYLAAVADRRAGRSAGGATLAEAAERG